MRELADLLLFADLFRESENGSAYWSSSGTDGEGASQSVPDYDTTPDDVADELGVHD
jgi:hypothetical protein